MNRLITALLATAAAFVLLRLWFGPHTPEAWAQLGVLVVALLLLAGLLKLLAALWRAARRVRVTDVARTAGALTGAAQGHAAKLTQAFKDGRRH